jgi:hypothetical protein
MWTWGGVESYSMVLLCLYLAVQSSWWYHSFLSNFGYLHTASLVVRYGSTGYVWWTFLTWMLCSRINCGGMVVLCFPLFCGCGALGSQFGCLVVRFVPRYFVGLLKLCCRRWEKLLYSVLDVVMVVYPTSCEDCCLISRCHNLSRIGMHNMKIHFDGYQTTSLAEEFLLLHNCAA